MMRFQTCFLVVCVVLATSFYTIAWSGVLWPIDGVARLLVAMALVAWVVSVEDVTR